MLAVLCDVTQRSALRCSIVREALSIRPRKRPTWTNTSMTAKATPLTVMKKRSLSCSSDFVARSTIVFVLGAWMPAATSARPSLLRETLDQHVDGEGRAFLQRLPVDPSVVALGDLQGDDSVYARPDHLGQEVDVFELAAEAPFGDALADDGPEERVGVLLGVALADDPVLID